MDDTAGQVDNQPDSFTVESLPAPYKSHPPTKGIAPAIGHPRQCSQITRATGRRCGAFAARGATVCQNHGAALPPVKRAIQQRLLLMAEPALDGLLRALQGEGYCDHCGRSDDMSTVVRAAQIILDRAGFGPTAELKVDMTNNEDRTPAWLAYATPEEMSEVLDLRRRARELTARVMQRVGAEQLNEGIE